MKHICTVPPRMPRLVAALCSSVCFAACVTRPSPVLTALPATAAASPTGSYCYRGPMQNVTVEKSDSATSMYLLKRVPDWPTTRRESGFVSVPLRNIARGSVVTLERADSALVINWITRAGRQVGRQRWPIVKDSAGVVEVALKAGGGAPMGVGRSRRSAEFVRGADGTLTVVEHYREKGLGLLIIPFADHMAWRMVLDADAVCDGG